MRVKACVHHICELEDIGLADYYVSADLYVCSELFGNIHLCLNIQMHIWDFLKLESTQLCRTHLCTTALQFPFTVTGSDMFQHDNEKPFEKSECYYNGTNSVCDGQVIVLFLAI